jgi:membrane-bound lytic murein transglycosylase D
MRNRITLIALALISFFSIPLFSAVAQTGTFEPQKQQSIPSELKPPKEDLAQVDETPADDSAEEKPYYIPMVLNDSVENHLEYFKTRGKDVFQRWLEQSARYIPMMREIFREKSLPEDLVYVAMIESGFNPYAVSWARAVGPWQFMPSTGKLYGLRIDWWVDERKDPIKSTYAAAEHLKDLYNLFGSWPLALASYNAGAGKVQRAVLKSRAEDFWDLKASRYIRKETKNYIPKYMAATIIAKNPEAYGFTKPAIKPFAYDEVIISDSADLRLIARCAGCSYEEIKELNPSLRRWITPPQDGTYVLRIPTGRRETFLANYAAVPSEQKIRWERHQVSKGETLSTVAILYHSTPEAIRDINGLKGNRIAPGKHLLVPVALDGRPLDADTLPPNLGQKQEILYRVRRGETLWKIAQSHNVTVADIKGWNRGIGKSVRAGQKIKLIVDIDQI